MANIFTSVPMTRPRSNTFNLSHDRKYSTKFANLVPCFIMEIVPGDSVRVNTAALIRMAPLVSPVMHEICAYHHFFFVPTRILWDNFQNFITGGEDGQDNSVFPFIQITAAGIGVQSGDLADYLGLPNLTGGSGVQNVSAVPFAAYQRIFSEYYRDQNLTPEPNSTLTDGDNNANANDLIALRKRALQHDYFTSALPFTQKGPEATIPLGTSAPIIFDNEGVADVTEVYPADQGTWQITGNPDAKVGITQTNQPGVFQVDEGGGNFRNADIDNSPFLSADLSGATAATINELRQAFRLQEWLEKNARGGSRYTESILSHFGVRSSDARLQRPEFLGGNKVNVAISEVLQTSGTGTSGQQTPQANMAGHGIAAGGSAIFNYFAEEHGYIIGIQSIMPKTAYQQGIPKHFLKFDKFDYYWPSFASLGEQPIDNVELYFAVDGQNEEVFGYTPRYSEYKYIPSTVHGQFRTTLDFWHLGRIFGNRPALNTAFIQSDAEDYDRIFAVAGQDQFYIHMYHKVRAKRRMPYFGKPMGV